LAELLKGGPAAQAVRLIASQKALQLKDAGVIPTLAVVRVGAREDDIAYERSAVRSCEKAGAAARLVTLPADIPQESLIQTIRSLNGDRGVHGVLLFRPLPKEMDDELVRNTLAPEKDVDGITDASLAGVFTGSGVGYAPCTAGACVEILDHYGIDLKGKRAVVVGRSLVVGKPLAMLLLARHATVTVCHTRTKDLAAECRRAEILIACAGKPKMLGAGCFAQGQTVIDVGINVLPDGSMCGDCDFDAACGIVSFITPVPGGVGTVTAGLLVRHTVDAAHKAAGG